MSPTNRRLRNITVTLEEDAVRWVRIEAARQGTSMSRFLGSLLKEEMLARGGATAGPATRPGSYSNRRKSPRRPKAKT